MLAEKTLLLVYVEVLLFIRFAMLWVDLKIKCKCGCNNDKISNRIVNPLTFQTLSQNFTVVDMFKEPKTWDVEHISLAQKCDLFLVAPASANIIGKVANGIADDMLSTTIMASDKTVVFAPAMNTKMYENRIVQDNIDKLVNYGYNL